MLTSAQEFKIGLVLGFVTATLFICLWWNSVYSEEIFSTLIAPKGHVTVFIPEYEKYVGSEVMACCGLGNMMWRFASLYGIGRQLNRTPYIEESWQCMKDSLPETMELFPEYGKRMRFVKTNSTNKSYVKFGRHCCKYDDVDRLKTETNDYLLLGGNYFQNYRYFYAVRNEIRFLFLWSKEVRRKVKKYGSHLFGSDSAHKLCIHTRLRDFVRFKISSKQDFTEAALEYSYRSLLPEFRNVSVVLLGEDKEFLISIIYNKTLIPRVYIPRNMSRGEDMAFATLYCDSLVITAQASTFAWWIGYLMRANWDSKKGRIYFNSDFYGSLHGTNFENTFSMENFPTHWVPLRLTMAPKIEIENNDLKNDDLILRLIK